MLRLSISVISYAVIVKNIAGEGVLNGTFIAIAIVPIPLSSVVNCISDPKGTKYPECIRIPLRLATDQ